MEIRQPVTPCMLKHMVVTVCKEDPQGCNQSLLLCCFKFDQDWYHMYLFTLTSFCCSKVWSMKPWQAGKGGELTHDETTIIAGALELSAKTAAQAMTPISSVFSLDVNAKLDLWVGFSLLWETLLYAHYPACRQLHRIHLPKHRFVANKNQFGRART